MKNKMLAVLLGLFAWGAQAQMTPVGLWRTIDDDTQKPKAEIRIRQNDAGVVSGVIEKALITSDQPNCNLCTDDRKDQPKVGMEIIRGAKKVSGKDVWEDGNILDPENGKTYTLRMTPMEGGSKLQVRGYIGFFFRNQMWIRIQ
jgi:uncharacterized protein (DUF2147 family)